MSTTPQTMSCPRCGGEGEEPGAPYDLELGRALCSTCKGSGEVPRIAVGDRIWWDDPADGTCSQPGKVIEILVEPGEPVSEETIFRITTDAGGFLEATYDELHLEASAGGLVRRLLATTPGPEALDGGLDDMVHDAASALASDANNEGTEGQVAFLVKQWGLKETEAALKEAGLLT